MRNTTVIDWDLEDVANTLDVLKDPRKTNQMPFSVLEAMSYTISYMNNSDDGAKNDLSRLMMELESGKPERWLHDNNKAAKDMLEFWGFEMMQNRLAGRDLSKWQKTVSKLTANPHQRIIQDDLRVIITLTKFTALQKRYHSYAEQYKTFTKRQDEYLGYLTLVDTYQHSTTNKSVTVYAFASPDNHLYLYELSNRHDYEKRKFLDKVLSLCDNRLLVTAHTRVRPLTAHMYAMKITYLEEI